MASRERKRVNKHFGRRDYVTCVVAGCAADVATATRDLALPFRGNSTNECGFPHFIRNSFHVRAFWLPDDFYVRGGTTVPLNGGLVGF